MNVMENQSAEKRFKSFSKYASLIVMALGVLALVGWIFDIQAFKSVLPGLATLKANTALAFLLAGIALWVASQENVKPLALRLAQICRIIVFLIGLLTLGEYQFERNIGIDQLIFTDLQTPQAAFPGRMAFATALCFALIGAASISSHAGTGKVLDAGQYLAVVAVLISFLALVGYIYDVQALHQLGPYSSMALHTAAGLALLALGTLSLQADRGWVRIISTDTAGGVVLRRLLPFVLGIPLMVGWLIVLGDRAGLYEANFGLAIISVLTAGFLVVTLWLNGRQLNRLDADRTRSEEKIAYQASLLANVNDAIVASNAQFRLTAWNAAAEEMYGWRADEVLGRTGVEILQTEFPDIDADEMRRKIDETGSWRGEATQLRKDGKRISVELSSIVLHDAKGQISGYLSVNRDITERKRADEEIRALNTELEERVVERTVKLAGVNEQLHFELVQREHLAEALLAEHELLQALMDNIPDTIYFKDTASRFTRINRAQVGVLGVATPEAAIGKTDFDFFPNAELVQSFYNEEQHILETGEPLINRIEFNPTPDGQPRWFSATKVPIKDSDGGVLGIVGISRDITERRQAEEALSRSEERFRLMAWATQDAIWDWDLRTNQIWWGAGLQKIFHYTTETLQTDPEWWLDHIHPEDRAKVNQAVNAALEGGMEFWSKEYRFQRMDGTYADIMDRAYIIREATGQPSRMIGAMMDITERRQDEATIRHQNEMLSSLHQITLNLLRYREIDPLLHALVNLSATFLDAPYVEIMLADGGVLVVKAATKNQLRMIGERVGRADALLSWQAFDTHEPAVLSDYASWPNRQTIYDSFPLHAVADFPILSDDQCLGVLSLGRDRPEHEFNPDQIQFGRLFANLTALVLNNAQLREALREQSIRDPLTGLYNRRYMEEALKQQLSRVTRHLHPLGVIMVDIDHFKSINDTYGHATGDAVLRELGQLLKKHVRNEDIACRYGGEEFLLIMPDASLEATQQRAEFLRQAVKRLRLQNAGPSLEGITLSLGVAIYPQHGRAIETVLLAADAALYRAKQAGRDRVVVAD